MKVRSFILFGFVLFKTTFSSAVETVARTSISNCIFFEKSGSNGDFSVSVEEKVERLSQFCNGKKKLYVRDIDDFVQCSMKNRKVVSKSENDHEQEEYLNSKIFKFINPTKKLKELKNDVYDFCDVAPNSIERFKEAEASKELKEKATEILSKQPYHYLVSTENSVRVRQSNPQVKKVWTYFSGDKGTQVLSVAIQNKDFAGALKKAINELHLKPGEYGNDFFISRRPSDDEEDEGTYIYKNTFVTLLLKESSRPFVFNTDIDKIYADASGDGYPEFVTYEGGDGHFQNTLNELKPMHNCPKDGSKMRYISVAGARVRNSEGKNGEVVQVEKYNSQVCLLHKSEGYAKISLLTGVNGWVPDSFLMEGSKSKDSILSEVIKAEKSASFKIAIQ